MTNPKCEEVGCGEWKAKQIPNPDYKGKWSAPLIDNPEYKVRRLGQFCCCQPVKAGHQSSSSRC